MINNVKKQRPSTYKPTPGPTTPEMKRKIESFTVGNKKFVRPRKVLSRGVKRGIRSVMKSKLNRALPSMRTTITSKNKYGDG